MNLCEQMLWGAWALLLNQARMPERLLNHPGRQNELNHSIEGCRGLQAAGGRLKQRLRAG